MSKDKRKREKTKGEKREWGTLNQKEHKVRWEKQGKEKKHVSPSAVLKGQVWILWRQLSAGRLLCFSTESGLWT